MEGFTLQEKQQTLTKIFIAVSKYMYVKSLNKCLHSYHKKKNSKISTTSVFKHPTRSPIIIPANNRVCLSNVQPKNSSTL